MTPGHCYTLPPWRSIHYVINMALVSIFGPFWVHWIFHSLKVFSAKYANWNTPLELWQKRHRVRKISCCLGTQSIHKKKSLSSLDLWWLTLFSFPHLQRKKRAWGEGRNGRQVVSWRCLSEKSYQGRDWSRVLCMTFNYTGASGDCTHPCARRCQYAAEEKKTVNKVFVHAECLLHRNQ